MPRFNQSGPMGQGPMTGRKMWRCTNFGAKLKQQPTNETQQNSQSNNSLDREIGLGCRRLNHGKGFGLRNRFRGGLSAY